MSHLLESLPEFPLNLPTVGTVADPELPPLLPAPGPPPAFPGAAVALKHLAARPRGPLAEAGAWHHGGINE